MENSLLVLFDVQKQMTWRQGYGISFLQVGILRDRVSANN